MNLKLFLCFLVMLIHTVSFEQGGLNCDTNNPESLNEYVLKEVNKHRKKAKVHPLYNDPLLLPAANDHAGYMSRKDKLTHYQRNKEKKTPKNRVDFYGEQFAVVGENCLQNWLKMGRKQDIKNCEELAKVLVTSWRNSPPHYANMISEDYSTTYTAVKINEKGKIYACQLFGSDAYKNSYRDSILTYDYKPANERRCRRCDSKLLRGAVYVIDDSLIMYQGAAPMFFPKYERRRPRPNRYEYGIAADIVLKEQYSCDSNIVFNGKTAVRGIPLEPVFKKDFKKGSNIFFWKFISIELGVVPEWIDQDYEVNLTVINNNRTCLPIIYNILPTEFHVDVNTNLYLDSLGKYYLVPIKDSVVYRIKFGKSEITAQDSLLRPIRSYVFDHLAELKSISVVGKASIEGNTESNELLYKNRAQVLTEQLIGVGIDSARIAISSQENFEAFRKDIVDTDYAFLNEKTNTEIKVEVNQKYADELENLLAEHRYAEVSIYTERFEKRSFDKDTVYKLLNQYVAKDDRANCKKIQAIEYGLLGDQIVSLDDLRSFNFPIKKDYVELLCDRYLMIYENDTLNPNRLSEFKDSLASLRALDYKNQKICTNLAILNYEDWIELPYRKSRKYYDTLLSTQYVDKVLKSRMILNYASTLDWRLAHNLVFPKKYLYNSIKPTIKPAKLDIRETFELGTYYAYFRDYQYSYQLTKKKVYRGGTADETVFFLKLIYYLNESLSDKTVIKHFKRIARMKGDEFCTYFNSPYINFQIMDDPEIREIYCEICGEN
ncbi:MAG: hypothetical protein GQ574_08030 [Crocinitomix sp.]|nr:hypothetical protein [Crocinitomix sp.]